jgi:hypothetical protein
MSFFKVSIIDFFGILCPGVLLLTNLSFLLLIFKDENNLFQNIPEGDYGLTAFLLLFVISYLFGFILRLISPDSIEKLIIPIGKRARSRYIKKNCIIGKYKKKYNTSNINEEEFEDFLWDEFYKNRNKFLNPSWCWRYEDYPYYFSLRQLYYSHLPTHIVNKIVGKKEKHSKDKLNFYKAWLTSEKPELAVLTFKAEAFIRFMSGAFWALVIGVLVGIFMIIYYMINDKITSLGLCLTIISFIIVIIIFSKFIY